jgi:serine phosphatase RsbU (regulator of sigma subunit)
VKLFRRLFKWRRKGFGARNFLVPSLDLEACGHSFSSYFMPAVVSGGDWWCMIPVRDRNGRDLVAVFIGDVAGHDAVSAKVVSAVQKVAESLSASIDLGRMLSAFNRAVCSVAAGTRTMTFFAVVLDPYEQKITFLNAGQPPAYLLESDKIIPLTQAGIPLGSSPDTVYDNIETMPWFPGSKLVLYTDGLVDWYRGTRNLFDGNQLRKSLVALEANGKSLGGRALLNGLLEAHKKAVDDLVQTDDVTILVCESFSSL